MRLLVRSALAALAGTAAAISFEPLHWWPLLPLAVAGVTLLAVEGPRLRSAFWTGFVFGSAFMLVLLPWLQVIGFYAWIPLALVEGLFYGLAALVTRAVRPLPWWPLWAATAWVLAEMLRGLTPFGGFPWGRLAFATEDTPVAPAFAYVGAAGVTFLVALVGTALAWAALRVSKRPVSAFAAPVLAGLLACLASFVPWNPGSPDPVAGGAAARVRVAAVQGNVPGKGLEAFAERRAVLDNHVEATLALAARVRDGKAPQPDIVVWPENSSDIDVYADPSAAAAVGAATRAIRAPLLMGAVVGDRGDEGWHNRAIVWSPRTGRPGATYDKTHAVPFGEYIPLRSFLAPRIPALEQIPSDMVPGTRPGVLKVGAAHAGVLMCFEVAYDGLVRDVVRGGADVVVVPTNNATYTGTGQIEQQFAMSRLRAIETGRWVVVASTNGISGIVDPSGAVVARAPERAQAVLERDVTLMTRVSPAIRAGAWIEGGLAAVAVVAALVGLGVGYRRRAHRDGPPAVPVPDRPVERAGAQPAHEHS